tara:strand:- start:169 stop:906 length:738 start_codon:yes stop_codon:yes gene_type:complete
MINLEDISLSIPIFTNETRQLKKTLLRSVTGGVLQRESSDVTYIKALSNINCFIEKGERVALIGHNGSGKTSFLKIISSIYFPTSGKFQTDLRIYPMINKSFITSIDLSGYVAARSYYLMVKGTQKGFSAYLEEVVNFSGIGDYIYLPIKTYSTGMASRLNFSILTAFDFECLALDEGLGAGDNDFTEKAQKRADKFIDQAGTLIFASHSDELLRRFCQRGLVFERGNIVFDGQLNEALDFYYGK